MKNIFLISFALLGLLFSGCGSETIDKSAISKTKKEETNIKFESQPFTLISTNEKFISIQSTPNGLDFDEFKGKKAVLVDIFATWCPPCIESIPKLRDVKEKYKDNFEIVSVLFQDDKTAEEMKKFIEEYKINYTITMGGDNQKLADEFNVKKIPEMFLFSKDGKFVKKFIGKVSQEELERYIKVAIEN